MHKGKSLLSLCYLYFSISNENYAFFTVLNKKLGEYVLG